MHLKQIVDESFGDYKECAMLLVTPDCKWKCEGCQNHHLALLETQNFPDEEILQRFANNPLSTAIVLGGLEPLDNMAEVCRFIFALRKSEITPKPTVVIYTGYELEEIEEQLYWSGLEPEMKTYGKVLLKYGRYIPNQEKKWNEQLGVHLASPNQGVIAYSRN